MPKWVLENCKGGSVMFCENIFVIIPYNEL